MGPLMLVAAVIACLAPFAGKAFGVDEPLFAWVARRILSHPLDPYGFSINWSMKADPMWQVMKNPPLASYYAALVAGIAGLSETALHLGFMLPAIGVVLGTFVLARRFCSRPVEAAFAALLTPVFLVCAASINDDVLMLALWVWAIEFWLRGLDTRRQSMFAVSGVLVALATMTQLFGISLVPLLLVYSALKTRRLGPYALYMLIPVAAIVLYQWWTYSLYHSVTFLDAFKWASGERTTTDTVPGMKYLSCLAFIGGGVASALFLSPVLWSGRALLIGLGAFAAMAVAIRFTGLSYTFAIQNEGASLWMLIAQLSLLATVGVGILSMAAEDVRTRKDADSILLTLWLAGTIVFALLVNWSVNGRAILPIIPVVGILMMRRLERTDRAKAGLVAGLLAVAGIFALTVTWSDYNFANMARKAAAQIGERYGGQRTMWVDGHWGFQYYMESLGGEATGYGSPPPERNDVVIVPSNNVVPFPGPGTPPLETIEFRSVPLAIMDQSLGAGYYSDMWGPLPFAIGRVAPERYDIYLVD